MSTTIQDIARLAGVSKSTVSLTLRRHPLSKNLSRKTKDRIRKIAAETGYKSNAQAVSIRTGKISIIAIISGSDILLAMNLMFIVKAAAEQDYSVKLFTDDNLDKTFETINANRIGLVLSLSAEPETRKKTAKLAQKLGIKLVFLYEGALNGFPCINVDNHAGTSLAVKHLISQGHRKIAYAGIELRYLYQKERQQGYLDAMEEAGLSVDPDWLLQAENIEPEIRRALTYPEKKRPTAFVCVADSYAMLVERVAIQMHIRIPEELMVIGFCDGFLSEFAAIPLTTLEERFEERSKLAVRLLLGQISFKEEYVKVTPQLVLRKSTEKGGSNNNRCKSQSMILKS